MLTTTLAFCTPGATSGTTPCLPQNCSSPTLGIACFDASTGITAGDLWVDQGTLGNDLTMFGTFASTAIVAGSAGGISFSGTNTYGRRAAYSPALGTTFTIAAWVFTSASTSQYLASVGRSPTSATQELSLTTSGFSDNENGAGFTLTATAAVPVSAWHHVAFVRNGLAGAFYLDGAPNGVGTAAKSVVYLAEYLAVGADIRSSASYLSGYLGQIVFLNFAFTAADVSGLYQSQA